MKPIIAIWIFTVIVSPWVGAHDIRSKVGPLPENSLTDIIDPDKRI